MGRPQTNHMYVYPQIILSVCTKKQVSGDSQVGIIQLECIQAFNPWEHVIYNKQSSDILLMPSSNVFDLWVSALCFFLS